MVRDAAQRRALTAAATHRKECSDRNACDAELLMVGGFSPLTGFMNKDEYEHVVEHTRQALMALDHPLPSTGSTAEPRATPPIPAQHFPLRHAQTAPLLLPQAEGLEAAVWAAGGDGHQR